MLLIEYIVKKSRLHGLGVFAAKPIPKGTVVWKFDIRTELVITEDEFKSLPPSLQEYISHFSYKTGDKYIICRDGAQYMNHTDNANTEGADSPDGFGITIASRDIGAGEEITSDYQETDELYSHKLNKNNNK